MAAQHRWKSHDVPIHGDRPIDSSASEQSARGAVAFVEAMAEADNTSGRHFCSDVDQYRTAKSVETEPHRPLRRPNEGVAHPVHAGPILSLIHI